MHSLNITSMDKINIAEKQERYETVLIRLGNYKLISTFIFDPMADFEERLKGSVRITVEPYETIVDPISNKKLRYMFVYEYKSSLPERLQDMKEFDSLKAFHKYIRDTKNIFTFKQENGRGILTIKASKVKDKSKNEYSEPVLIQLPEQEVYASETIDMKQARIAVLKQRHEKMKEINEQFKKIDELSDYDEKTVVFESFRPLPQYTPQQRSSITKAVIRFGWVDLNIPENNIRPDRQLFKMGKLYVYDQIKKFENIEKVNIQWNKMCVRRQISEVIKHLSKLKKLKSLNFDGQSNQFTQQFFIELNAFQVYKNLEELHIFFNIAQENNYFDQSWWHPEHRDQYKGRLPIDVSHWIQFSKTHPNLKNMWIGRDFQTNKVELKTKGMELYTLKDVNVERKWESFVVGMYEDLKLDTKFWNLLRDHKYQDKLKSICFSRLLNVNGDAIKAMLERNSAQLQNFMLCWCDGSIKEDSLSPLKKCLNLKYLSLRSSPFKPNDEVTCSFLAQKALLNLQFLNLDCYNHKQVRSNFLTFIKDVNLTKKLKYVGLPRNDWITVEILRYIAVIPSLRSFNIYNNQFEGEQTDKTKGIVEITQIIATMSELRVLNIGACSFTLENVKDIVVNLKQLKKLNMSDISSTKTLRSDKYKTQWSKFQYPKNSDGQQKIFRDLSEKEINEFLYRINNEVFYQITPLLNRITHLDIRNIFIDEKPFGRMQTMPNLRYINCEFDLYKKIDSLGRKQITYF